MTKILSLLTLGTALLSLGACAANPIATTNSGGSGVVASSIGSGSYRPLNHCPANATDLAGELWHPNEYCLPGGR